MENTKQTLEEVLFEAAVQKTDARERSEFLQNVCRDNPTLRVRLEVMLEGHFAATEFLTVRSAPLNQSASPTSNGEASARMIGRYKLLEKLGEGGFGEVWMAEQREPVRRAVALKIIKLGMDTRQVVARFEAERQALAVMDHPNIAKVLDASATETGRPYFVMELVRGIKITEYCDQNNLPNRERLDLFIKVCQAIQHAHQKGIIHRDIKPSNILVTLHDGVPVPKVIDFGIAKATQGELTDKTIHTQFHQFIGTPAYMSPEQAEMSGLDIDTRSDIYSLGVLLYELLTGTVPFDVQELMSQGIDAMRKTIREKEPPRPSTKIATLEGEELTTTARKHSAEPSRLAGLLRGDLDWIVMKCLEKDRTRRYETAIGLARDLERYLGNEPVNARPPSAAYRFQKAFRRNKIVFGAAAAVLLALLAGFGISLYQYIGKSRAERAQVDLRKRAEAKALEASQARAIAAEQRDLARENLYQSLVREARSIRKTREIGYRSEVFDRLKQAIAVGSTNADRSTLRREAAASFGDWVGLAPVDITIPGGVFFAAVTPDASLAALALRGKNVVSLRETSTGRELAELVHGGEALSLAFDPKGRGLFILATEGRFEFGELPERRRLEKWSARYDGSWAREWSRENVQVFRLVPTADAVLGLVLGPSHDWIAVQALDSNQELTRVPVTQPLPRFPIADLSADQRQLAFFSLEDEKSIDWQLEVWDVPTLKRVQLLKPKLGPTPGLSFSPDGRALAATFVNALIVYDTSQFGSILGVTGSFGLGNGGGSIGGGGRLLAIPLEQELAVRLVQMGSGREQALLSVPGRLGAPIFSGDGSMMLLPHDQGCRIVRLRAEQEKTILEGHQGGVPAVEFSPDGKQLASTGKDRTLRLWDLTKHGDSRVLGELPAPGQTISYSSDGAYIACGYYVINEISIWSTRTGQQVALIPKGPDHEGATWTCAFSPDGAHLAAAGGGVRVWRFADLLRAGLAGTSPLLFSDTNGVSGITFDPAGQHIAFQDISIDHNFRNIRIRNLSTPSTTIATNCHGNVVQGLSFLPKSGALAYVTLDREVTLLNPGDGRVIRTFPTLGPKEVPRSMSKNIRISHDESRLAVVSGSGLSVDLWDPATGKLLYTLPEEPDPIWWLAWAPDSRHLAVTRGRGEIAIWNLADIETQLARLGLNP